MMASWICYCKLGAVFGIQIGLKQVCKSGESVLAVR